VNEYPATKKRKDGKVERGLKMTAKLRGKGKGKGGGVYRNRSTE
jgi:hypothetical protein